MMHKRGFIIILSLISLFILLGVSGYISVWGTFGTSTKLSNIKPTLKVFPIDPSIQFIHANSTLTLEKMKREKYKIKLHTSSETTLPAYLRQDISLIFANGILVGRLYGWKEATSLFEQHLSINGVGSARYDVITFHHAEIHHLDQSIGSQQALSQDHVYILTSAFSSISLFREPLTNTQKQWQRILDHAIQEQWDYQWKYLINFFNIDGTNYKLIPITQLFQYQKVPFPNLSQEKTQQIIGSIWESIYRQYMLGQVPSQYTQIDPEGSTVPIILLAKDGSHLHILFRTAKGQEVQLVKQITP